MESKGEEAKRCVCEVQSRHADKENCESRTIRAGICAATWAEIDGIGNSDREWEMRSGNPSQLRDGRYGRAAGIGTNLMLQYLKLYTSK